MRNSYFAVLAVNGIILPLFLFFAPERGVPHFNDSGEVAQWVPVFSYIMVAALGLLFITGMMMLTDFLMTVCPAGAFNVPHAVYWKKEENIPELRSRSRRFVWDIGFLTVLAYLLIQLEMLRLCRQDNPTFHIQPQILTGILIFSLILLVVRLIIIFRPPANGIDSRKQIQK